MRALLSAVLIAAVIVAFPARASAQGAIDSKQPHLAHARGAASALRGRVQELGGRLGLVDARVRALAARVAELQVDLDARRAALLRTRDSLYAAQKRLTALQEELARDGAVLARQAVATYEADPPDLVTVVLEAHGFGDLMERLTFARRVQRQDVRIVSRVRRDRTEVASLATRL